MSTSKFSTLVPITELPVKQAFSHYFLAQVSENGQYTYIFVHVNVGLYKIPCFIITGRVGSINRP